MSRASLLAPGPTPAERWTPVPLALVQAPTLAQAQDLLRAAVRAGDLLVFVSTAPATGELAPMPDGVHIEWLIAGCPCCTGQVVFRTRLVQWIRRYRPLRIALLTTPETHLGTLEAQLQDPWLQAAARLEPWHAAQATGVESDGAAGATGG
jgi:hypothetical protein